MFTRGDMANAVQHYRDLASSGRTRSGASTARFRRANGSAVDACRASQAVAPPSAGASRTSALARPAVTTQIPRVTDLRDRSSTWPAPTSSIARSSRRHGHVDPRPQTTAGRTQGPRPRVGACSRRAVPERDPATANLQHPNLLPLFDSGRGRRYVMPFVEGESRARLEREKAVLR
jgi:hypothetical protein